MKKTISKLKTQFIKILKQGTSPRELALCVSGAAVLGLFPVLGSTTILITLFAFVFRLNLPTAQLVNFSVYPLQLILLIPFMKLGETIFGIAELNYSLTEMIEILENDFLGGLNELIGLGIQAVLAWLLIMPVLVSILYFTFKSAFTAMSQKLNYNKNKES